MQVKSSNKQAELIPQTFSVMVSPLPEQKPEVTVLETDALKDHSQQLFRLSPLGLMLPTVVLGEDDVGLVLALPLEVKTGRSLLYFNKYDRQFEPRPDPCRLGASGLPLCLQSHLGTFSELLLYVSTGRVFWR